MNECWHAGMAGQAVQAEGRLEHEVTRKRHEKHESLPAGQAFVPSVSFREVRDQSLLALIREK